MKTSETRYERKWELRNYDVNTIILKIYKSNFLFRELYKKRFVNSIYFDNFNHDAFSENLSGISIRKKTRLRWYDDQKINLVIEIGICKILYLLPYLQVLFVLIQMLFYINFS